MNFNSFNSLICFIANENTISCFTHPPIYMLKTLFFTIFLFLSIPLIAQKKVDSAAIKKAHIEKQFARYKQDYNAFEQAHGHYIQTPNVRMHYLTWGNPSGIPIVWCHGTFGTGYEMYDIADTLTKEGYYLIAIDYYGHGLTPVPSKEVSLYHVADDIKFLLDELKISKAIIGGFSRGGSVATAFYSAYPAYVSALVLEDGGSVAWATNEHKQPVDSIVRKYEEDFKHRQPSTMYNTEIEAFTRLYNNNSNNPSFTRFAYSFFTRLKQNVDGKYTMNPGILDLVGENTAEALLTTIHRPYASNAMFGVSTQLIYPKLIYRNLNVPMLIFDPASDNDWFDVEKDNALLQQAHPQYITHKIYRNTGHAVKNEKTAVFIQDLLSFLKTVK